MSIFWTSDLHLNDLNCFRYERQLYFNDIVEYHNYIIRKWNTKVKNSDTVIMIGDIGTPIMTTLDILLYLKGHKVLVIGNHDEDHLDYYKGVFDLITYVHYIKVDNIIVCSRHIPVTRRNTLRQISDYFVHGHHHIYNEVTWRAGANSLIDKNKYNACIDLNNYEPCTLSELQYNKPYQLQFFENYWYRL